MVDKVQVAESKPAGMERFAPDRQTVLPRRRSGFTADPTSAILSRKRLLAAEETSQEQGTGGGGDEGSDQRRRRSGRLRHGERARLVQYMCAAANHEEEADKLTARGRRSVLEAKAAGQGESLRRRPCRGAGDQATCPGPSRPPLRSRWAAAPAQPVVVKKSLQAGREAGAESRRQESESSAPKKAPATKAKASSKASAGKKKR